MELFPLIIYISFYKVYNCGNNVIYILEILPFTKLGEFTNKITKWFDIYSSKFKNIYRYGKNLALKHFNRHYVDGFAHKYGYGVWHSLKFLI